MDKCAHCKKPGADNTWEGHACADKRRIRKWVLCDACDHKANEWLLTFFNVHSATKKIARYKGTT